MFWLPWHHNLPVSQWQGSHLLQGHAKEAGADCCVLSRWLFSHVLYLNQPLEEKTP